MMQPGGSAAPERRFNEPRPQEDIPRYSESQMTASRTGTYGLRSEAAFEGEREGERPPIAPELLEFLQPEKTNWSRPMVWLGVAGAVLLAVFIWLIVRPKPENQAQLKPALNGTAANYTYAEINAEPWATIKKLTPANGDAQSVVGSATPLRVKLPAGQYSVTLEGPNHEQKQAVITVPQQGGTTCFVLFRKPDINRLLSQK
jgi:hypothetical protein